MLSFQDGAAAMSQSVPIREQIQAGSIVAAGRTVLLSWTGAIASWLNRRQERQDLSALDDRLLADVGIPRDDKPWKAGKPFESPSLTVLELEIGPIRRS